MHHIVVSRLEKYPHDEPNGWAVGFHCTADNDRSFFIDTVIPFDAAADDEAAVAAALVALGNNINSQLDALNSKSALLGSEVDLPDVVDHDHDDDVVVDDEE